MSLDRRQLVAGAAGAAALAALGAAWRRAERRLPPGRLLGPSAAAGHRLRDRRAGEALPAPRERRRVRIAVAGGGVAGLAAAWRLAQRGETDFVLLELEAETGGNAASGRNATSAYPWGAHYVTLPGDELTHVRRLYEELGVISGYDAKGLPIYDDGALCAEPQERLYLHGRWQEGLVPQFGAAADDRRQMAAFDRLVTGWRERRGDDGKRAFTLPVDQSSRDPRFLALDRQSLAVYLREQGFTSKYLHWYVNYCCRDDFGATSERTSAWAGLHYFAARHGVAANAPANAVLTWPEGNGFLVHGLAQGNRGRIETGKLVLRVASGERDAEVLYVDAASPDGDAVAVTADAVVCCLPQFVARHVVQGLGQGATSGFSYAPWVVANLTLAALPRGPGAHLAWDNVSFYGPSLGYVVATHQVPRQYEAGTVITYYRPLTGAEPDAERRGAFTKSHGDWATLVLADLEAMHPGISQTVLNLDAWVWGHGMIRPTPGFLWGGERSAAQAERGRIAFAHSDLSGLSLFEEAFTRGVEAADRALELAAGAARMVVR